MMDRNGTFDNLKESHYALCLGDFEFRFSTKKRMERFIAKFEGNREDSKIRYTSLSLNYETLSIREYSDLSLYCDIEKDGFYVVYKGSGYECREKVPVRLVLASKRTPTGLK